MIGETDFNYNALTMKQPEIKLNATAAASGSIGQSSTGQGIEPNAMSISGAVDSEVLTVVAVCLICIILTTFRSSIVCI